MIPDVRELRPDEWGRLENHPSLQYPLPSPEAARVVIAEVGDTIVAYWLALQVIHLEPIWIHEDYRGGHLIKRMLGALLTILASCRVSMAFCFSDRAEISGYLKRLGFKLIPWEVFGLTCPKL